MRKFKLAVTALLALFALCAAAYLFSAAFAHFRDLARQSQMERRAAFRAQEEEFHKMSAEHAEWRGLPAQLREFRKERIISMDDFAAFRRDLNSRLDDNGFHGASISFQFGSSQNRMRKVAIGFSLKGSYRQLKKFIFDMEKSPKMHFFDRIVLSGSGPLVTGNFSMEAYLGE